MAASVPSRKKRLAFAAVTAGTALVLSAATLEIGARAIEAWRSSRPKPPRHNFSVLMPNPHGTGSYRVRPSLELQTRIENFEVVVHTNRHGMNWHEVAKKKERGRERIAILGDSFAFGCWATRSERSFAGVLESKLPSHRYEVLNFGVPGYGLADEELYLREEVLDYHPDFVMIAFYTGNDVRDTYLGIDKERIVNGVAELDQSVLAARVPAKYLATRSSQTRDAEPSPLRALLQRSAAYRLMAPLMGWDQLWLDFAPSNWFLSYGFWSKVPPPAIALEAKDETLATLERIRALAASHGARLSVVSIPSTYQVYSRAWSGLDFDIAYPQIYVQTYCNEHDVPYLDLLPLLREHVLKTNDLLYVRTETHFNDRGHAVAGEAITDFFKHVVRKRVPASSRQSLP